MYPPPEPPFYFWLATVPLYGTPLFVTFWAVRKFGMPGERGQFRTPAGNARAFVLIVACTALAALIAFRLYGYGKQS